MDSGFVIGVFGGKHKRWRKSQTTFLIKLCLGQDCIFLVIQQVISFVGQIMHVSVEQEPQALSAEICKCPRAKS